MICGIYAVLGGYLIAADVVAVVMTLSSLECRSYVSLSCTVCRSV